MSKINLLVSDLPKSPQLAALSDYYMKLTKPYLPIDYMIYGCEKSTKENRLSRLKKESLKIEKIVSAGDVVVLLSEKGSSHNTFQIKEKVDKWLETAPKKIIFVLGGAHGLHMDLFTPNRPVIALGPMTMPHELALVIWLEQLYRICTLRVGKKYHY